jgi:hypothetical protein
MLKYGLTMAEVDAAKPDNFDEMPFGQQLSFFRRVPGKIVQARRGSQAELQRLLLKLMASEGSRYQSKKSIGLAAFQNARFPKGAWWQKKCLPNQVTWEIKAANAAQLWSWYDGLSPAEKTAEPASAPLRNQLRTERQKRRKEQTKKKREAPAATARKRRRLGGAAVGEPAAEVAVAACRGACCEQGLCFCCAECWHNKTKEVGLGYC